MEKMKLIKNQNGKKEQFTLSKNGIKEKVIENLSS